MKRGRNARDGFAILLVLLLLALLMIALCASSALVKVNGQISDSGSNRTRARQNALLGLRIGISDLQNRAGPDECVTGMAGVTGIPAQADSTTRNWCGIWESDGRFVGWLTSGARADDTAALMAGIAPIKLVGDGANGGAGSVGASAPHSEHVIAGRISITVPEISGRPGVAATIGSYAYFVADDGVKISAYTSPDQAILPGMKPLLTSISATSAQGKLRTALDGYSSRLPQVISYEQLSLLPSPAAALTQSVLQDNFHHVSLAPLTVRAGGLYSGAVNINTTSPYVWRSLLETYNAAPGVTTFSIASLSSGGTAIAEGFALSNSGKNAGGPFTSIANFGASDLLAGSLPGTITPADFMSAMSAMLTTRSDTFRVRAYGDAVDPLDGSTLQAIAYCEAILQRVPEMTTSGAGRKCVVTYFRWLGPEDI